MKHSGKVKDKKRFRELRADIEELNEEIDRLRQAIDYYRKSTCWKITKPLRIIGDIQKNICFFLNKGVLKRGLNYLKKNGIKKTINRIENPYKVIDEYQQSSNKLIFSEEQLAEQKNTIFSKDITISIIVPLYNTSKIFLTDMINSVQQQTYSKWELCLADGSDDNHAYVETICKKISKKDSRIKYKKLEKNLGISENTNAAITMSTGEYIGFLDHDDMLHPSALFEVMHAICDEDADFVYTDECLFSEKPEDAYGPRFKPDYAPDTLLSNNYICHFSVVSKKIIDVVGGFRSEYNGSQDHDFILRATNEAKCVAHIPEVLYFWRCHPNSVASGISAKTYAVTAGQNAVKDFLHNQGKDVTVSSVDICPTIYRVHYKSDYYPTVSIVIANCEHLPILKKCINSILKKTTYKNYEIVIVENNSKSKEIFAYYESLEKRNSNIRVVTWSGQFNYSEINNLGVEKSKGDVILFLNNDTEVITPQWIEEMLCFVQRPDVGAVGAKLYYPNGLIQHAGVVLGYLGVAENRYRKSEKENTGYLGNLFYVQNLCAVTGACLMIRKNVFLEVGGFEKELAVAFNDVDLCMRLRKHGYVNVWTPFSELYHHESISRGYEDTPEKQARCEKEILFFKEHWKNELESKDPYYNPNFILEESFYTYKKESVHYKPRCVRKFLADNISLTDSQETVDKFIDWPVLPKKKINKTIVIIAELSVPQCKLYRVDAKKNIFERLGYTVHVVAWHNTSLAISFLQMCDFVLFYRVPFFDDVKKIYAEADRLNLVKYYDVDDLIFNETLYKKHLETMEINNDEDIRGLIDGAVLYRKAIEASDVFITSTSAILSTYREMGYDKPAFVLPNGIPAELLRVGETCKKNGEHENIRIFYGSGTKTHNEDFKLTDEALCKILKEYPQVQLYFLSEIEISDKYEDYADRVHKIKSLKTENYYSEISNFDIALMPLSDTFFNECKSNIKYIEASILHIPSIASDLPEFSKIIQNKKNGIIAKTADDWYLGLKFLIENPEERKKMAENAFATVNDTYSIYQQTDTMEKILQKTLSKEELHFNNKPSILFTNCYYGLNHFGGATVVVEGLAESLAARYSRKYDVYVFTVHADDEFGIGSVRKYVYNNVTVFSCCAPIDMSCGIDNPIVNTAFELVLQTIKPSIVHNHAVQGFGYGISKICTDYRIPYVVTLHDAWVCCPRLFMIDTHGKYCGENGLLASNCYERCMIDADFTTDRRKMLMKYLADAKKVYVPSYYAKKVMQQLIPNISFSVNKNGIFFLKQEKKDQNEKVRFLFVAGGEDGKGYSFLIDALREIADLEWELFLIVPSNRELENLQDLSCHIKILGHQSRAQMQELFEEINVLLFPTLNYESFGLTVREAIMHDCFVVSSRCGGPEEAIVDGKNGKLFDKGDKETFVAILRDILKNKDTYLKYKTSDYGDVGTFDNQADELLQDYKEIMRCGKNVKNSNLLAEKEDVK